MGFMPGRETIDAIFYISTNVGKIGNDKKIVNGVCRFKKGLTMFKRGDLVGTEKKKCMENEVLAIMDIQKY